MKNILIILFSLIIISCEKDDIETYYSIETTCKLDRVESLIYGNPMFVPSEGFEIIYNSQNQVLKKLHFYQYSETEIEDSKIKDSICYNGGIPNEGYFIYRDSEFWMRHEKYTFNGSIIKNIEFTVYSASYDYRFLHKGITTYEYENSKIIASKTITDNYATKTYTNCNYKYDGDNLIQVDEVSWNDTSSSIGHIIYMDEDTVYTTKKYSNYNDKLNPYNGLFLLLDFREESLSKNVYNYFEETKVKNGTVIGEIKSSRSFLYFDNNLPESDGWHNFYYDCD